MVTIRQIAVMENITEKIRQGKLPSISRAMREVGYSEETAKKPNLLTNSKGWQELLAQYFPDEKITRVLNDLLECQDKRVQLSALDILLKLKDKYPAGKLKVGAFEERDKVVEE